MRLTKLIVQKLIAAVFFLLVVANAIAADDAPLTKYLKKHPDANNIDEALLFKGAVQENIDVNFYNAVWPIIDPSKDKITNVISLIVNEAELDKIKIDFTATVNFNVDYTLVDGSTGTLNNQSLSVNYTMAGGLRYDNRQTLKMTQCRKVKITILDFSNPSAPWDFWDIVSLQNHMLISRDYVFDGPNNFNTKIPVSIDNSLSGEDELTIKWPDIPALNFGKTHYDIEWTWVDQEALDNFKSKNSQNNDQMELNAELIFKNNSTRVTVESKNTVSYNIPLIYDGVGQLFFRIRPVQLREDGHIINGAWSAEGFEGITFYVQDAAHAHEPNLNWQTTTSFAEEGKRKTVVQYFDGTLRSRQTVTKDNVTNRTVVAESFYDYQGRAAINILPAPTLNSVIQYTKNFNVFENGGSGTPKEIFDLIPAGSELCGFKSPKLDKFNNKGGAAQYYSDKNPEKDSGFNKYIPEANGYPYTETRYTPDATGRIEAQGGMGEIFQLGNEGNPQLSHATKYYYAKPDQKELDAMFGTEAGIASHYSKNMVRDANGQYSVSYVDMHGRTVATALAGVPPANLNALETYVPQEITKSLISPNNNKVEGRSLVSNSSLIVTKSGTHTIKYEVTPQALQLASCPTDGSNNPGPLYCYECYYDLEIKVTGACGYQKVWNYSNLQFTTEGQPNVTLNCNTPILSVPDDTMHLTEGEYHITKRLTVNKAAQDFYRENVYSVHNICKKLEDFYKENYEIILKQSNCVITCSECTTALGTFDTYRNDFLTQQGISDLTIKQPYENEIKKSYDDAYRQCEEICNGSAKNILGAIKQAMLDDMTPGQGQYAGLDEDLDGDGVVKGLSTKTPVYNEKYGRYEFNSTLPFNIFNQNLSPVPFKNPKYIEPGKIELKYYLDEFGNSDPDQYSDPDQSIVPPLSVEKNFANYFKPSWAKSLLFYHPEYKKLLKAETDLRTSYEWDAVLETIDTWDAAANIKHYIFENYGTAILNSDPFFNGPGAAYRNEMAKYINQNFDRLAANNQSGSPCFWKIAWLTVFCHNNNTLECSQSAPTQPGNFSTLTNGCTGDWNQVWRIFRSLYLSEKERMVSAWLDNNAPVDYSKFDEYHFERRFGKTDDYFNSNSYLKELLEDVNNGKINDAKNKLDAQMQAQYADNCAAYKEGWIKQLLTCETIKGKNKAGTSEKFTFIDDEGNYIQNDFISDLITGLNNVCIAGSDATHPMGSSTVKPGTSPNVPQSFQAVFNELWPLYFSDPQSTLCHAYMIEFPQPYERQKPVSDLLAFDKKDSCLCNRLSELYIEKNADNSFPASGSLSEYLVYKHNTIIRQTLIDSLVGGCTGTCNFWETPLDIPAIFSCNTPINNCIDCDGFQKIKEDFYTIFKQKAPIENPQSQSDVDLNNAFVKFANNQTGFTKSGYDYIRFMQSCPENISNPACDSLNSIFNEFKEMRKGIKPGQIAGDKMITDCVYELVRGMNAIVEAANHPENPIFSDNFCLDTLSGPRDSKLHSVRPSALYSNNDSLFHTILPLSLNCGNYNLLNEEPNGASALKLLGNQVESVDYCSGIATSEELSKKYYAAVMDNDLDGFRIIWSYVEPSMAYNYYGVKSPMQKYLPLDSKFDNHGFIVNLIKIPSTVSNSQDYLQVRTSLPAVKLNTIKKILGIKFDKRFLPENYINVYDNLNGANLMVFAEMKDGNIDSFHIRAGYEMTYYLRYKETVDPVLYGEDCQTAFTKFFNQKKATNYTYAQIDSIYFANCGNHIAPCDTAKKYPSLEQVISDYQSQYLNPKYGYVDYDMRTFAGNKTPDEGPKGVFDINQNLIGNTVDGTPLQVKQSFVQVWNSSTVNQAVGTLSLTSENKLRLTLKQGQTAPCDGIIGMRYYQFDTPYDTIDAIKISLGTYIDFADGQKIKVDSIYSNASTIVGYLTEPSSWADYFTYYWVFHKYPNAQDRTVTVYHTDINGIIGFDNFVYGKSLYLPKLKNLRGYAPQHCLSLAFKSTQDPTLNTLNGFKNKDQINGLLFFGLGVGDLASDNPTLPANYNFGSLEQFHDLSSIGLSIHNALTPLDLDSLLPNIPVNFPKLRNLQIGTSFVSSANSSFALSNGRNLLLANLTSPWQIDSALNQYGRAVNRNTGYIHLLPATRTTASDTTINKLKNQSFSIWLANNEVYNGNLWNQVPMDTLFNLKKNYPYTSPFTEFYNQKYGTNYTYHQLKSLLKNQYGYEPDICTFLTNPAGSPMLCDDGPMFPSLAIEDTCNADLPDLAMNKSIEQFRVYKEDKIDEFDQKYLDKCFEAVNTEIFTITSQVAEYHYTLYYYNQAGNLVKTVPPAEAIPNFDDGFLAEVAASRAAGIDKLIDYKYLKTEYRYNTLNQVTLQKSPDGGESRFWYDVLGRLVVSQNQKQRQENKYSYTIFDALGRINEVGEKTKAEAMDQAKAQDPAALTIWLTPTTSEPNKSITRTIYDNGFWPLGSEYYQQNMRNRVSLSCVIASDDGTSLIIPPWETATYYSYDIHGNVDMLVQDYNKLLGGFLGNRFKKITYDYDLISGKVNQVNYQPGLKDAFYHRYKYDAENKILEVETSRDAANWSKDASYFYYRHGPLARTVLGNPTHESQGIDYAYTLQGWLKGVNATSLAGTIANNAAFDMGQDGKTDASGNSVIINHQSVNGQAIYGGNTRTLDAFGFSLNYFNGDYQQIATGAESPFASLSMPLPSGAAQPLFNGNIGAMAVAIPKLGNTKVYGYNYDQLNRLTNMNAFDGINAATNAFTPIALDDYRETISYDANGNILTYKRNGAANAGGLAMDDMTYQYEKDGAGKIFSNKLRYVHDQSPAGNYADDIDSQTSLTLQVVEEEKKTWQTTDNYRYDEIGNLIEDKSEGLNIEWNVYGKISKITKVKPTGTTTIDYTYDAAGNRISKKVVSPTSTVYTYYVRDASGNVMSIYNSGDNNLNAGALTQSEIHLYGSSRLGIYNTKLNVELSLLVNFGDKTTFTVGDKHFELTNHLGNVLATVSDKIIPVKNASGAVAYFEADVVTASDYYAFGMITPGRKYSQGNSGYRYGFNSQEKSDEISGLGNHNTALFGEYDTRLVRRWNLDPKPDISLSPYAMFSNNPILFNDIALDTPRNAGNGVLGQRFNFTNDGSLSPSEFQQMQTSFLDNLNQQMNRSGRTYNGNAISLNTSDPLASIINVTFGSTGISKTNLAENSIFISQENMSKNANVSTHEWLHTAGLMDRYYELYGMTLYDNGDKPNVDGQRSGTVPMGILPPGHDNDHNSTNMMASSGAQITQMQWNIVFNLGATGITEESLGTLGKVSFVYSFSFANKSDYLYNNRKASFTSITNTTSKYSLTSNAKRIAFSSTTAYHMQGKAMLALPNATFSDISPANLQNYIIHNRTGNILGSSLLQLSNDDRRQLNNIKR